MSSRSLNPLQVAALLISASYGIGFLFGSGELAIAHGMAGSIYGLATAAGMLGLALFAVRLWKAGTPIWDMFGDVYGDRIQRTVALLSVIWMSGVLAAQIQGGVAVLELLGTHSLAAYAIVLALILAASRLDLRAASALFSICLVASGAVLLYALHATGGLSTYLNGWHYFAKDFGTFKPAAALATTLSVAILVCMGADYHQFVLAARRPLAAVTGCILAAIALSFVSLLPPALIVTMAQSGSLNEVTDARQVVPFALAQVASTFGRGADKVLLAALSAAALGSGAAILRAMVDALRSSLGRPGRERDWALGPSVLTLGALLAAYGKGIVYTMVSVNTLYISAIGLVFVGLLVRRPVPQRSASVMLFAGLLISLCVYVVRWVGLLTGDVDMLAMSAGLLGSATAGAFSFALDRGRPAMQSAQLTGPR